MSPKVQDLNRLKAGKIECTVTFSKEEVTPAEAKALKKLGEKVSLPGFRPGSVPEDMLKEKVDDQQLLEETIHSLLPEAFEKVVKENDIKPVMHPKVEAISRDPLSLKITFVEKPEVKLKGVNSIKVEKKEPALEEKEVQKMVDFILQKHQTAKEVDRPAKKDDQITMDFWGSDENDKEIEGIRTREHQVVIGSKVLLPGFEDNLIDMKKGDQKEFTLTFPEKYHAEHLQGKPVTFHVSVTKIEEVHIPEVTDEFAQKELGAKNAEDFTVQLRESMMQQEEQMEHQRRERLLMEEIRKATKVELAEELIDDEMRTILKEFEQQLSQQGMTLEDWITKANKKAEELQSELRKQAEDRLTLRLGLQQIVLEKEVSISDEEMHKTVEEFLSSASPEQRKEVEPSYQQGQKAYEQLKWQRTVEKLLTEMLAV